METKNNQIRFNAEVNESLINAIRRYSQHIPVLAIEDVEISKNDSPLYDETVAHRLGLIPLKYKKALNDKTSVEIKLNYKKEGDVLSGELESSDAEIVFKEMPITSLNKNQEIQLTATAKAGIGIDHSKFSPGIIFYREVFDIKVDKDCPLEVLETCPKGVFEEKTGKVVVRDSSKCDFCEECIKFCESKGKDFIKISPNSELIISVESFGQFTPKEILKKSMETLKKDLVELGKKVK